MNNGIVQQKPKFSVAITTKGYQTLINNTLGDPERAKRFVASITSAVAVSPALQDCDAGSILACALLGESLSLSPSPQLGHYYLVPFNNKDGSKKAQFVLGYKGYMQLAIRSGQLKKLLAIEIKQGELNYFDPINEVIDCVIIEDWDKREAAPTIGYYAMFETLNGYRKAMYWSKKQMLTHADKYSPAFSASVYEKIQRGEIPDKDMWKYSSFWYKDFDAMAKKTMLRQLLTKGGCPMSTELITALERDSVIAEIDRTNDDIITMPEDVAQLTQPEAETVVEAVNLNDI
ncbi:MAG: recombinase [Spirochaetales bacterium]|nr:recombinase [Spirochaetales bacterium]